MKDKMDEWMFGCDVCQDVCPWNRFSSPHNQERFKPHPDLLEMNKRDWQELTEDTFKKVFSGSSPLKRAKFSSVNAQVNAANIGHHTISKYLKPNLAIINENEMRHEMRNKSEKLDVLIKSRISSRGKCYENFEKYGSHACVLKKSQDAFEKYVNATCKENKYSLMNPYCEMMLKKDRLKWLDKSL